MVWPDQMGGGDDRSTVEFGVCLVGGGGCVVPLLFPHLTIGDGVGVFLVLSGRPKIGVLDLEVRTCMCYGYCFLVIQWKIDGFFFLFHPFFLCWFSRCYFLLIFFSFCRGRGVGGRVEGGMGGRLYSIVLSQ